MSKFIIFTGEIGGSSYPLNGDVSTPSHLLFDTLLNDTIMKACRTCGEEKTLSEFYKKPRAPFYFVDCKQCHCKKTSQRIKESGQKKTQKWVLNEMYFGMGKHAKKRNYDIPDFTNTQFKNWCYNETDFENIYNEWVESGHNKWKKPSVDRINNYISYTFNNMRLVTWLENFESARLDILTGKNTKQCKTVYKYDLSWNLIDSYFSTRNAGRLMGVTSSSISQALRNNTKCKGYYWSYEEKIIEYKTKISEL